MLERLRSARTGGYGRSNSIQNDGVLLRALAVLATAVFTAIIVTLSDTNFLLFDSSFGVLFNWLAMFGSQ